MATSRICRGLTAPEWLVHGSVSFSQHALVEMATDGIERADVRMEGQKGSTMKCLNCGSSDYVGRRERHQYVECGLPQVTLENVLIYRCGNCDAQEVVIPNIEALHGFIAQLLVQKPAPLDGR
jgi:hypothetical protein